jgi:hypothetical protein
VMFCYVSNAAEGWESTTDIDKTCIRQDKH